MAKEGRSINRRVVEDLDSGQRKPAAIQWEGKELSRPRNEVLHRSEATAFRRVVIVNDKVLSRPRPNDRASSATLSPRGPLADLPCRHSLPRNHPIMCFFRGFKAMPEQAVEWRIVFLRRPHHLQLRHTISTGSMREIDPASRSRC